MNAPAPPKLEQILKRLRIVESRIIIRNPFSVEKMQAIKAKLANPDMSACDAQADDPFPGYDTEPAMAYANG